VSTFVLNMSYVALWALVFLLTITVMFLAKEVGVISHRLGPVGAMMANPGPDLNTSIEQMTVQDLDGASISIGGVHEKAQLLVFISPGCTSCEGLAAAMRTVFRAERRSLDVVLAAAGDDNSVHNEFRKRHRLDGIPYVVSSSLRNSLKIGAVPYALLIDRNGLLRSKGLVNSLSQMESLLNVIDTGYQSVQERARSLQGSNAAQAV
jgi:methylamine dehydrogenase accessory protein MauD